MRWFALLAVITLSACTQNSSDSATLSPAPQAIGQGASITVWIDQELEESLETIAEQYALDTGDVVELISKDFYAIEQEFPSAADEDKPDLVVGSSDWVDAWVSGGLVAVLNTDNSAVYPSILQAFSRAGVSYGLPYATENAALICNAEVLSSAPKSWSDLMAKNVELAINPGGDPYLIQGIQSSFGVETFSLNESGDYTQALGLSSEEGLNFAQWFKKNQDQFPQLDYAAAVAHFATGQTPCWLTGMWSVAELKETVAFELTAYPLPSAGEYPSRPFSSSRAFFLSSVSDRKPAATKFLEYLAADSSQLLIHLSTARQPVTDGVLRDVKDPIMRGFIEASKNSIAVPNPNQMQHVWGPLGQAQIAILNQDSKPAEVWKAMITAIETNLGN